MSTRRPQTCARAECCMPFVVGPGQDRNSIGRPVYCSEKCKRRETSAIQRAAWTELTRRHRAEFIEIRTQIRKERQT